jgi:serine/threonine protein kinase
VIVPARIGKYAIGRKLGEGATSAVYLAHDDFADREVAIKLVFPDVLADREKGRLYRHLLENEAALGGKLVHPHIVQIHDAVIDAEQSYLVVEYVPGGTLEAFCTPDRLLPFERLVEIVFKCTRALEFAHRMGITHRDIKPANILLASAAEDAVDVKISDFGAAIDTDDQTRTQVIGIGSPAYMSPQQVREMPLNHQTDIWSLGVVMYQLLTGRLPFQAATNPAIVYQICNTDPPPPSAFRADTPASLDAIVARAMQKEVGSRYATWDEFSHDLAQAFRNRRLSAQRTDFADSEKFEALRTLQFFAEFTDAEIWEVVRFSRWEDVAPQTLIMKDGDPGDYFCLLLGGELGVVKRGRMLNVLSPGECFGEMAVVSRHSRVRGADVIARTDARVMTVPGEALRRASNACRMHFYEAFLEVLASRLALANARMTST